MFFHCYLVFLVCLLSEKCLLSSAVTQNETRLQELSAEALLQFSALGNASKNDIHMQTLADLIEQQESKLAALESNPSSNSKTTLALIRRLATQMREYKTQLIETRAENIRVWNETNAELNKADAVFRNKYAKLMRDHNSLNEEIVKEKKIWSNILPGMVIVLAKAKRDLERQTQIYADEFANNAQLEGMLDALRRLNHLKFRELEDLKARNGLVRRGKPFSEPLGAAEENHLKSHKLEDLDARNDLVRGEPLSEPLAEAEKNHQKLEDLKARNVLVRREPLSEPLPAAEKKKKRHLVMSGSLSCGRKLKALMRILEGFGRRAKATRVILNLLERRDFMGVVPLHRQCMGQDNEIPIKLNELSLKVAAIKNDQQALVKLNSQMVEESAVPLLLQR